MTNDPAVRLTEPLTTKIPRVEIDVGLRQFLISVYNYMASGLALSGLVAYGAAKSGLYASLVQTPLLFRSPKMASGSPTGVPALDLTTQHSVTRPPLPAAVVYRGIGRLLCRDGQRHCN